MGPMGVAKVMAVVVMEVEVVEVVIGVKVMAMMGPWQLDYLYKTHMMPCSFLPYIGGTVRWHYSCPNLSNRCSLSQFARPHTAAEGQEGEEVRARERVVRSVYKTGMMLCSCWTCRRSTRNFACSCQAAPSRCNPSSCLHPHTGTQVVRVVGAAHPSRTICRMPCSSQT